MRIEEIKSTTAITFSIHDRVISNLSSYMGGNKFPIIKLHDEDGYIVAQIDPIKCNMDVSSISKALKEFGLQQLY